MADCPPPPLTLRLFGSFEAYRGEAPVPRMRRRKDQWLLALLALRPGAEVARTWLAGTLWPDSSQPAALANLRQSLKGLRRALGPEAPRLHCPTTRTLSLDLSGAEFDVREFDAAFRAGDAASLRRAVALYRGPLLEDCAEEWVFQERQTREQAYLQALEALAAGALAADDPAEAERCLRRAIAVDPLRESAQRALMQVLAAGGSYAAALHCYRELRLHLHRELNTEPDAETQTLFHQLRGEARRLSSKGAKRDWAEGATERAGDGRTEPAELPPFYSLDALPNNLPRQLTSFIGREQEIAEVKTLLSSTPLLTLTGSGGCGKTRLALQVAAEVLEEYPDGVWLVELAALTDPAFVAQTVAAALALREEPNRPLVATLIDHLRPRSALLVLDNCEHLLAATAQLAESLLRACPRLRILTSSREGHKIAGETTYRVPSLSVPDPRQLPAAEQLTQFEAARLFVDRARTALPSFILSAENAPAVAQVCHRLGGIALAIELAAARMRALSVEQIAARLDDRFRLLTGGSRTALRRHQTLRAMIDWSYDLLSEAERALLRRLSVFAGGWTLEAAEAVTCGEAGGGCAGDSELASARGEAWEVVDGLEALVAKSLVQYETSGPEARYRLLETVRQYSRDRLLEAGEAVAARDRHRDWFLALAERAEPNIYQVAWVDRLETEHENLRAALEWCREAEEGGEAGLRLATALTWLWIKRGHFAEARQWFDTVLAGAAGASAAARGRALVGAMFVAQVHSDYTWQAALAAEGLALGRKAGDQWIITRSFFHSGWAAMHQGHDERAQALGEEGLAIAREVGDKWVITLLVGLLGNVAMRRGDDERAALLHGESLALNRELKDPGGMAAALDRLGHLARQQGDHERAEARFRESLTLSRKVNDRWFIAVALSRLGGLALAQGDMAAARARYGEAAALVRELNYPMGSLWMVNQLGHVACMQGDYEAATALHRECLAIWHRREEKWGIAWAHHQLGIVAQRQGDYPRARAHHTQSLSLQHEFEIRPDIPQKLSLQNEFNVRHDIPGSLEQLAAVAAAEGQPRKAARILSAAAALRETGGFPVPPAERAEHDQRAAALRATLGEAAFAAAWAEGRAMESEAAVRYALEG